MAKVHPVLGFMALRAPAVVWTRDGEEERCWTRGSAGYVPALDPPGPGEKEPRLRVRRIA